MKGFLFKKSSIKTGVILSYLTLAVSLIVSLFYPPFLQAHVGKEAAGAYQFAGAVGAIILLLSFGIENSFIRFGTKALEHEGEDGLAKTNYIYRCLFGGIAILQLIVGGTIGGLLLSGVGVLPTASDPKLVGALLLVVTVSYSLDFFFSQYYWNAYLQKRLAWVQILQLANKILTPACCVLALVTGGQIIYVAIATAGCLLLIDLAYFLYAILALKVRFLKPSKAEFGSLVKEIITFSIFIFLTILVFECNSQLGRVLLGNFVGMAAVNIFTYGLEFYVYEVVLANAINRNYSPQVNECVIRGDVEGVKCLFLRATGLQTVVLVGVAGGFIACGAIFIPGWLGKTDLVGADFHQIYIIGMALLCMGIIPFSQGIGLEIARANNKHRLLAVVNVAITAVGVLGSILAILFFPDEWQVYGPLVGSVVSLFLGMGVFQNIYFKKVLNLPIGRYFARLGICLAFAAIGAVAAHFVGRALPMEIQWVLRFLITAATFLLPYAGLCLGAYVLFCPFRKKKEGR